jgi:hypothetical protein
MKFVIILFLFSSGIALSGCSAKLVRQQFKPTKGGIVSYKNQGLGMVVEKRRNDANEKMNEFCGGPASIDSISNSLETSTYVANHSKYQTTVTPVSAEYVYMTFTCENQN